MASATLTAEKSMPPTAERSSTGPVDAAKPPSRSTSLRDLNTLVFESSFDGTVLLIVLPFFEREAPRGRCPVLIAPRYLHRSIRHLSPPLSCRQTFLRAEIRITRLRSIYFMNILRRGPWLERERSSRGSSPVKQLAFLGWPSLFARSRGAQIEYSKFPRQTCFLITTILFKY